MEKKQAISQALKLAVEKHNNGELREAEIIYRKILEVEENADVYHLLGLIAHQTEHYQEAIDLIKKAINLRPEAIFYHNLGMVYDKLEKEEESSESFLKAISINPSYLNAELAYYNIASYLKDKGNLKESLEYYNKAIEANKDFAEAYWNRGLLLLISGRLEEGWKDYEYRFKKNKPSDSRIFNKPKWDGSILNGKRILVVSEQGFGDNIQFVRYIPWVKERGGYVILECKKGLEKLFKSISEIDQFVAKENSSKVDYDFYIHLMSLPRVFGTNLNSIPNKTPYLQADLKLVDKFREKIQGKFKIGICWKGNPNHENDKNRSISFEKFRVLKEIPGVKLFSLQKEERASDSDVVDLSEDMNDFADSAAIVENLDLVISVDTSIAHLAGSLNKPVWTLLPLLPDWRYLLERSDCLWYPSMRLFRQSNPGDWDSLFSEVVREVKTLGDV